MSKQQRTRSALAERVRQQRVQLGLTQSALAARSGLSLAMIEKVEEDRSPAGMRTLRKLAPALDLDLGDLSKLAASSAPAVTSSKRPRRRGTPRRRESMRGGGSSEPTLTFPGSHRSAPVMDGSEALPPRDLTHEETGDWYSAQGNWNLATSSYLLAAQCTTEAVWARCTLRAGCMLLCLGQFDRAKQLIVPVVQQPINVIGEINAIRGGIYLGWIAREEGRYAQAVDRLERTERIARRAFAREAQIADDNNDSTSAPFASNVAPFASVLAHTLHFRGSSEVEWGMRHLAWASFIPQGIQRLEEAYALAARLQENDSMGVSLFAQLLPCAAELSAEERQQKLDQGRDLIGYRGTGVGHIHLLEGRLRCLEGDRRAAENAFNLALAGYCVPTFYPTGTARALHQIGKLQLSKGSTAAIQDALASLLTAAVLHPYGELLTTLAVAVATGRERWDGGRGTDFEHRWSLLCHERVWQMDRGSPFALLGQLGTIYQGDEVVTRIQQALTHIDQVVGGAGR